MLNLTRASTEFFRFGCRVLQLYTGKVQTACSDYATRVRTATSGTLAAQSISPPRALFADWLTYCTDSFQRSVLFWDTLRQRGNNFITHERAGKPPLFVYDYEMITDGRQLARPVNYALVRIIPPDGTHTDERKRPFIIIDPRAGHGPGIGGFKQDSQVGVALKGGHPVYFVIFFPMPEPGQTLPDVCAAEAQFVQTVVERHPHSPKPALIGNCQGGWATMLLAASDPKITGPLVINGAPMSYWSGNWHGGEGENPMRYLGGLLGGAWLGLLTADLGHGLVDGAHFVANFERLNPANTLWSKYYHLYANVDTEPTRFLEFERWWGGYFSMNEAELRWILDNLFVGNRLASGEASASPHSFFDLKAIRSPIIIFSSAGDNITPPQQALNWIADTYSSTEEIKANGQVIVGLLHPDVGHLGIFVSGKVAKKEHAQIVEVLKHIESLRPGLYVMEIQEHAGTTAKPKYEVTIEERRLEDLRRLNKLERKDESAFDLVAEVSSANERCYSLFLRPLIQALVTEQSAALGRWFHPLRCQRWAISDWNPALRPVSELAEAIRAKRTVVTPNNPFRQVEQASSTLITAGLNLFRDLRDATMEALFFQWYGPATVLRSVLAQSTTPNRTEPESFSRDLPKVQQALAGIGVGGYPEAIALMGALLGRSAGQVNLARLALVDQFIQADPILSAIPAAEARRIKSQQAVIAELEPERGLASLPDLLADSADRQRALALLEDAVSAVTLTSAQEELLQRIYAVLKPGPSPFRPVPANEKRLTKSSAK